MKHTIPADDFGPWGRPMAAAVQACVHCGFCLPTCPTYQLMGEEMDSPRGRIVLMKQALESGAPTPQALAHVDQCLGCLACETSCPSGVQYRELISPFRAWAEKHRERSLIERLRRWLVLNILPHPQRFKYAMKLGQLARPFCEWMPKPMRSMLKLLPEKMPAHRPLADRYAPETAIRSRIALLAGCVQDVLAPGINAATIAVLLKNGVEVLIPRQQVCCGALGWHVGAADQAVTCAKKNLHAFPDDVDAILTNAAGCGSCLHEYPLLLLDTKDSPAARRFAAKAQDLSVFLDKLGIEPPRGFDHEVTIVLQDACHLLHGQGVQAAPRRLLRGIPGVNLREMADPEICCGSAGTYNMDHPDTAADLGRRKAERIIASGAQIALTGNIGCLTQIRTCLRDLNSPVKAMHWVEFLQLAYEGGPA